MPLPNGVSCHLCNLPDKLIQEKCTAKLLAGTSKQQTWKVSPAQITVQAGVLLITTMLES